MGIDFLSSWQAEVKTRLSEAGIDPESIDEKKLHAFAMKKFKNLDVQLLNNVKQVEYDVDLMKLTNMIMFSKTKPIITGYNTLFHNHTKVENVPGGFLDELKASRSLAKKEMHKHTNDVDRTIYNSLDTKQLIFKLLANSYYGAFGQKGFHFFNALLGPSVTAQGRQLISSAILGFEGFLGDNIFFYNFDELCTFIMNIIREEPDDDLVVSKDVTEDMVIERLLGKARFTLSDVERSYIESVISGRSETVLQKLYFKNNIFEFFNLDEIKEVIVDDLVVTGFHDANSPPDEIKDILAEISSLLRYFVGYPYPYNNKTAHASEMLRKVVLVCDTDSNFLHVYNWLEFVCDNAGIDIPSISIDQRVSIVSVMTYFITKFIDEVFNILCANSNVPESEHHRINMKSEFHYKRVILTKNKKSYAGIILSKEGNVYEKPKFDIKGISIKKVSTPKPARVFFSQLLEERMLKSPKINIGGVYEEYAAFAKSITNITAEGQTAYLKPGVLKVISSYKKPFQMQSVRAAYIWNAMYPKEYINQSSTFKILDLKPTDIPAPLNTIKKFTPKQMDSGEHIAMRDEVENSFLIADTLYTDNEAFVEFLYETFEEAMADRLYDLFDSYPELKKYGLTQIAIPLNVDRIPADVLPFADVGNITNSVLTKGNILLESLGFVIVKSRKRQVVSNMIRI